MFMAMTSTHLNEQQQRSLALIAEHGSGVIINGNTLNALVRRGMVTPGPAPVYGAGCTARLTEDGRLEVVRIIKDSLSSVTMTESSRRRLERLLADVQRKVAA